MLCRLNTKDNDKNLNYHDIFLKLFYRFLVFISCFVYLWRYDEIKLNKGTQSEFT